MLNDKEEILASPNFSFEDLNFETQKSMVENNISHLNTEQIASLQNIYVAESENLKSLHHISKLGYKYQKYDFKETIAPSIQSWFISIIGLIVSTVFILVFLITFSAFVISGPEFFSIIKLGLGILFLGAGVVYMTRCFDLLISNIFYNVTIVDSTINITYLKNFKLIKTSVNSSEKVKLNTHKNCHTLTIDGIEVLKGRSEIHQYILTNVRDQLKDKIGL